jgi:hypothetical protein
LCFQIAYLTCSIKFPNYKPETRALKDTLKKP